MHKDQHKNYTRDSEFSYTIGAYPTLELIKHQPTKILEIIISSKGSSNKGVTMIEKLCEQNSIPCTVNDKLISKLAKSDNVYAIGIFHKYDSVLDSATNHLLLVNPSDMGNLGTIVRTMVSFDMPNLAMIKPAADIFHPKVIRASMGSIFQMRFSYFGEFEEYKSAFTRDMYAFILNGESELSTTKFATPATLIFGNEGAGLPEIYGKECHTVKIKQSDQTDSLNLAIAVGVALYSTYR